MRLFILALAALLVLLILACSESSSPQATPTAQVIPIIAPTPVVTPVPEEDNTEALSSLLENVTGPEMTEIEYLGEILFLIDDTLPVLNNVSILLDDISSDSNWFDELANEQINLIRVQLEASSLQPPAGYTSTHSFFLKALDHLSTALDFIESGARSSSIADLDKAIDHLERSVILIGEASDAMP